MQIINNYTDYLPIISKAKLLANIPTDHYSHVLQYLHATIRFYEKGELIQRLGEPLTCSGIVLDGTVEGSFVSESYNKINMNHFATSSSFAEALACVRPDYSPIQLKALTDCTVMLLDLSQITSEASCPCEFQQVLATNLIRILASQNVFANLKLRISSQRALRDKVLIYLHSLVPDAQGYVHVPFNQTALAEFLAVNRSALSRELGNMQNEGLILVDGRKMKLLF